MDEFGYLIKEAEAKFFDELTKEAAGAVSARAIGRLGGKVARKAKKTAEKVFDPKRGKDEAAEYAKKLGISLGHGGVKLARLIKESNKHGFQKEASEKLLEDMPDTYEKLASMIAATAEWKPDGMKEAVFNYLEELDFDKEAAFEEAEPLIMDAIVTDATIEAIMTKQAGAPASFEALRDELIKEAIIAPAAAAIRGIGGQIFSKSLGRGLFTRGGFRGAYRAGRQAELTSKGRSAAKKMRKIKGKMQAQQTAAAGAAGAQKFYHASRAQAQAARLAKQQAKFKEIMAKRRAHAQAAGATPKPTPKPKPTPQPPPPKPPPQPPPGGGGMGGQPPPGGPQPPPPKPPPKPKKKKKTKGAKQPGTLGEIHAKWQKGGWKALSDAEKRKVYQAGGIAFVGQRVAMDKPVV